MYTMTRSGPAPPRCPAGSYSRTTLPVAISAPSTRTAAPTAVAKGASVRGAGTSSKHSSGRICRTWSWHERSPATAALSVADASSLGAVPLPTCLIVRAYAVTGYCSCHPAGHVWQYRAGSTARRGRAELCGAAPGAPPFRALPVRGVRAAARRLVHLFEQLLPATVLTWPEHRAHDGDLLRSRGRAAPGGACPEPGSFDGGRGSGRDGGGAAASPGHGPPCEMIPT